MKWTCGICSPDLVRLMIVQSWGCLLARAEVNKNSYIFMCIFIFCRIFLYPSSLNPIRQLIFSLLPCFSVVELYVALKIEQKKKRSLYSYYSCFCVCYIASKQNKLWFNLYDTSSCLLCSQNINVKAMFKCSLYFFVIYLCMLM